MKRLYSQTKLLIAMSLLAMGSAALGQEQSYRPFNPDSTGGRPIVDMGSEYQKNVVATLWDQAERGYVRIEKIEPAARAPNAHPIAFSAEQIRTALSKLQVQKGVKEARPLFSEGALNDISEPIAKALAKAQPDQDVTFAATARPGGLSMLSNQREVTTGRLFYRDDQINVIFGIIKEEFGSQFSSTGVLRAFIPGSRTGPVEETALTVLPAKGMDYAAAERKDWITMAPYAWSEQPAEEKTPAGVPVAPVSASPTAGSAPPTPAGASSVNAPVSAPAAVSPPPKAAAPAAAVSSPPAKPVTSSPLPAVGSGETYYQRFEERLRALQKLRDNGLITEKEYQQKRRAILEEL